MVWRLAVWRLRCRVRGARGPVERSRGPIETRRISVNMGNNIPASYVLLERAADNSIVKVERSVRICDTVCERYSVIGTIC